MGKNKYDIFISYRHEGGDKYARTIQQALEKQYRVFLDFDDLKDGVFDQRIIDAITDSPVFLLILTKGALDRCVNKDDWVRQEIMQAIKSGCHIVPVTIVEDNFEGIPFDLPKELQLAVGQHQFSELQMKTLFKASMEQLIRDRIAPYVHQEDANSGIEVHIDVDADCDMFSFKTFVQHLKAGENTVIHMNPGKYKLEFVSTQIAEVRKSMLYSLTPNMTCDIIEIAMKKDVEAIIAKGQEEMHKKRLKEVRNIELKPIKKEDKWGFADETGKTMVPCEWKHATPFSEGLAMVKNVDGKCGYIDKLGQEVIPCIWEDGGTFKNGRAHVKDRKWWTIDQKGNVLENLSEGFARIRDAKGKWGYRDKTGNIVIPCAWKQAGTFKRIGLSSRIWARVMDEQNNYGFIDNTGEVVIPCEWKDAKKFSGGLSAVQDEQDKWGFINMTGWVTIPCTWENAKDFSDGLAQVQDNNEKWGYIDKTGNVIIPCQWKLTHPFFGGTAMVMDVDGKWMMIDKTGKEEKKKKWEIDETGKITIWN